MKVLAASLDHETHSFSKQLTTMRDFETTEWIKGDQILSRYTNTKTGWGGVIDFAAQKKWTLTCVICAEAEPSGLVKRDVLEAYIHELTDTINRQGPFDGMLLMLHGAMIAEDCDDVEGEILRRVRSVCGGETPIAVSLDPHANVTHRMIEYADIIKSYSTTPHVDQYNTTYRVAELLDLTMAGKISPKLYFARGPLLTGLDLGRTLRPDSPMKRVQETVRKIMKLHPPILDISANAGYPYADIFEVGPSIVIMTDGDYTPALSLASELQQQIWQTREIMSIDFVPVGEAIAKIKSAPSQSTKNHKPVIIAEYSDGTGGGGYGDGTVLLKELISAKLENVIFGPIFDLETAEAAHHAGEGETIQVTLGAKMDPDTSGGPVKVLAKVQKICDGRYLRKGPYCHGSIGDMGNSAWLKIDGLDVVVCSKRKQIEDREQFRMLGLHPEHARAICCKGINSFRADFEQISSDILFVDTGGLVTTQYTLFPYKKVRRPIWPLDENVESTVSTFSNVASR